MNEIYTLLKYSDTIKIFIFFSFSTIHIYIVFAYPFPIKEGENYGFFKSRRKNVRERA